MHNDLRSTWERALAEMPLIAILRGIQPVEAQLVGAALVDAGFRIIEVPLNSPQPFDTIGQLSQALRGRAIVGAGTVLTPTDVNRTIAAGGVLIVAPNIDPAVAVEVSGQRVIYCPGVMTPSEAFQALRVGAAALKLFPAEMIEPRVVKAFRAVLPVNTRLFPVGGISPQTMKPYVDAGAAGFGIGSALYQPGVSVDELRERATEFVLAWQSLSNHMASS